MTTTTYTADETVTRFERRGPRELHLTYLPLFAGAPVTREFFLSSGGWVMEYVTGPTTLRGLVDAVDVRGSLSPYGNRLPRQLNVLQDDAHDVLERIIRREFRKLRAAERRLARRYGRW